MSYKYKHNTLRLYSIKREYLTDCAKQQKNTESERGREQISIDRFIFVYLRRIDKDFNIQNFCLSSVK
jgi:hypothetical protein